MGDIGRHVDEIARAGLGDEFEPVAPAHPGAPADHIDDALHRPVMVRAGLRHRVDDDRPGPQLLRAGARVGDRRGAIYAGCLGRVDVEFARMDHPDAVEAPSGLAAIVHGSLLPNRRASATPLTANYGESADRTAARAASDAAGRLAMARRRVVV